MSINSINSSFLIFKLIEQLEIHITMQQPAARDRGFLKERKLRSCWRRFRVLIELLMGMRPGVVFLGTWLSIVSRRFHCVWPWASKISARKHWSWRNEIKTDSPESSKIKRICKNNNVFSLSPKPKNKKKTKRKLPKSKRSKNNYLIIK